VDRLTTGRRHVRAGSVTVTELLTRQASPTRCTDSSPATLDSDATDNRTDTNIAVTADTDTDDAVTDMIPVVVTGTHRREHVKGAQLAKLASLGVAGVVLCGAVTISSIVAHQRREAGHPLMRPSAQITGEQALLPDKLDETLPNASAPAPAPAPHTPAGAAADERAAAPDKAATAPAPAAARNTDGTSASGGAVTIGPASDSELVREFYESLPDSPGTAFGMLSPDLLHTSLGEFLASWSTVTAIDSVEVVQRAEGVLATVRMRLADGGELRIEQLLTVAESPRRIVGVQLLSAQRN
jgi:hypothetical protein